MGERIAFWVCAVMIIGGALMTISRKNTVTAVMSLVMTFFGLAAIYTLLSAHFLAAIQILVYAGAIMTLFVFVVMVLNRDEVAPWALRGIVGKAIGIGALAYTIALTVLLLGSTPGFLASTRSYKSGPPPEGWGGVADVGNILFTKYLFAFEAISLLLLVAVIGAVVVARIPRHVEVAAPADQKPAAGQGGHG
ncbi:MAG: NADH-quinone oxidoreductase subunit J [Myxococcales bacterium]|nr:NADH-quinone oxidoreductase subunit J [Myxococcales bacterium]